MDRDGFEIHEEDAGEEVRLVVRGELDLATADSLDRRLAALADRKRPVLLDLRPLSFMDSSGLRSLMLARERAAGGDWGLRIIPPEGEARDVLRVSGVEDHLPLVDP